MGRGVSPPDQMELPKEKARELIKVNRLIFDLPKINIRDLDQVKERTQEYFDIYESAGIKPTMAGYAMCLGMSRQTLSGVVHNMPIGGQGNGRSGTRSYSSLPAEVTDFIKKTYSFLEILWESYMTSGAVNPPAGIFIGKNQFGYKDVIENVVVPQQKQDTDFDANEIRERYIGVVENQAIEDKSNK